MALLHRTVDSSPIVLYPGDIAFAMHGDCLQTLLGSCVSVILTTARREAAAMCHLVHGSAAPFHKSRDTSYASAALPFVRRLMQRFCDADSGLEAFVFGGANMFPGRPRMCDVGGINLKATYTFLQDHGIDVVFESVGGCSFRKVTWMVGAGTPGVLIGGEAALEHSRGAP